MKKNVTDVYKACLNPMTACHMWHYMAEDGVLQFRSGTIIQKDIWLRPHLYSSSLDFLGVYNHCLLKTENEAVVEGMCNVIGQQEDLDRGFSMRRYAKETRLV